MNIATDKLSVLIITKNEEHNIERCIRSLPNGAEVVVIDSFSKDKTCSIATDLGAIVYQRNFRDYSDQKNYGLTKCTRPWVLAIDADEEICGSFLSSLSSLKVDYDAYGVERRLFFLGRELRYGKTIDSPIRLFRNGSGRYVGVIHEQFTLHKGRVGKISGKGYLRHYSYSDLSDYFTRFNKYTSEIAMNHYKRSKKVVLPSHVMRPWVEFFSRYILRLGFLDGYPGYTYALISSLYAYVKYSKLLELRGSKSS